MRIEGRDRMKQIRFVLPLGLLLAAFSWVGAAKAQNPTAVQKLQLSAFAGAGADFTGLSGGKNLSVTAGADLALPPLHGIRPGIEIRGTYPADHGLIDSQKDVLGGLRTDFLLGSRLHPYADFLFGRGEMDYGLGGYNFGGYQFQLTTTYVYSPGAGFDYTLSDSFALKVDGQVQRWSGAPTASGSLYSTTLIAGVVYRFNFNPHGVR
jgi:hypothetical protein